MFTTATAANYRCTEGLLVWYEQEITGDDSPYIKLTRHATKRYSFLDIDPDFAASIVASKQSFYTRTFADWHMSGTAVIETYVTECMGEITSTETASGSRDISINVNEIDVKIVYSLSGFIPNPSSSFVLENARDYEESVHAKTEDGLSSYSRKRNFHVTRDLSIRYRVEANEEGPQGYIYTRYASKSFEYIGMNQTAAENCAKAKRSQYCREYDFVNKNRVNKTRIANGASISLRHNALTWSVVVQVNETDVKYSSSNVDPATLFTAENGRSYDGSDLLVLDSVTRETPAFGATTVRSTVVGSCNIPGYSISDATFSYRVGEDINWTTAEVSWTPSEGVGIVWLPVTDENIYCRFTCASTESDTIIAT